MEAVVDLFEAEGPAAEHSTDSVVLREAAPMVDLLQWALELLDQNPEEVWTSLEILLVHS